MKIYQIYSYLYYGDGVSNCIMCLSDLLSIKFESYIITLYGYDDKICREDIIINNDLNNICFEYDDIIIYHFANGDSLNRIVEQMKQKKILVFHNVTYPELFYNESDDIVKNCLLGHLQAKRTAGNYLKAICLSKYSKDTLIGYGWNKKNIEVIPLVKKEEKKDQYDEKIFEKYNDGVMNFLYVGRISPNKKIEDIINVFSSYQKKYNSNCRLLLVGNKQFVKYLFALDRLISELDVKNVIFTDHVTDNQLVSYYRIADIYVCMSEHEGLCIPLLEAMQYEVPIVAYASTAIPDTMGDAGILVDTKDANTVAFKINEILIDEDKKREIIAVQKKRYDSFNLFAYKENVFNIIEQVEKIQTYSYSFEDQLLHYDFFIDNKNQEMFDLENKLDFNKGLIIYGAGKAGRYLYELIKDEKRVKIDAFCDNGLYDTKINSIEVIEHKECIKKYPNDNYVITVQNDFLSIISSLLENGIKKEQIKLYKLGVNKLLS